jgi:mediator of DNA damage checkpoint protein 1
MGATIVGDGLQCTHLVTNKIVRTEKFLCALAVAPKIVNEQWMRDSIEATTWQGK